MTRINTSRRGDIGAIFGSNIFFLMPMEVGSLAMENWA